jgi:signal transduction histidine kinase/ActR/RegA family two-component response regulator
MNTGMKKTARIMTAGLAVCLCLTVALFFLITRQYRHNIAYSSATHLIEINHQGRENIYSLLLKEQELARDIDADIVPGGFSSDEKLMSYLDAKRGIWQQKDIYIYTEDGRCFNTRGEAENEGTAAQLAAETIEAGETFNIVKSRTEYAVAVDTELTLKGSKIVAVSMVNDLDTLLDDLGFKPFGGRGVSYLTRQNGVRICQSGSNAENVYNILPLFDAGTLNSLSGDGAALEDVMSSGQEGAFLLTGGGTAAQYVVLTPISFMQQTLYLFNIVPQSVVNQMMNAFVRNMTLLSFMVIAIIAGLFAVFTRIYRRRARIYNSDIASRERLFDLLVSETSNAYMLLEEGAPQPAYVTSNIGGILGGSTLGIQKDGQGYRLLSRTGEENNGTLSAVNSALAAWDGKKEFSSGYLPYENGGVRCWLRMSLYPVSSGGKDFIIGVVQDVTPEYEREESLRQALTMADSANRAKTRFLSSVSHDIRTPLNAIINMTRFLRKDISDPDKAAGEIDVVQQSSEHLLSLINDVLDMSRIESGRVSFVSESFNMNDAVNAACEIIRPLCQAKKQSFTCTLTDVRHANLLGDALKLNQILINILNNAVKFTPEGGKISFSAEELGTISQDAAPFRFTISDNGMGIPAGRLQSIFTPFSRVDNDVVRNTEGTGLGLAITKSYVEALGGKIYVKSSEGEGSVFTVELSYAIDREAVTEQPKRTQAAPQGMFRPAAVLLVEDNAINLSIATTILESWGLTVESAENGQKAVEAFLALEPGHYGAVFMDIQMPVMNGYEAARAIRACGREDGASVPIIAMTANAFAEDVEQARAAGMNAHVAKPIDPDELRRVTGKFLAGREENKP